MTQQNPNLSLNQQGKDVALLQSRLINIGYTIATSEILSELFGQSTYQAVLQFQQREGLRPTGVVDAATAEAIVNKFESDKTVIFQPSQHQQPSPTPAAPQAEIPSHAAGQIGHSPKTPGQPPVEIVRESTPPPAFPPAPATPVPPVPRPVSAAGDLPAPPGSGGTAPSPANTLRGTIYFEHGLPARGLEVRLYNLGFGGAEARLDTETVRTDDQGAYTFTYSVEGRPANLEVRVVGTDGKEIPISAAQYNPGSQKVLNLVAPASVRPLEPEYQRLYDDLKAQLGPAGNLGAAQEDRTRRDLTYLAQATGWDPRLIALAATATRLSVDTKLPQDMLYALLRTGLPTDVQQLAWVNSQAISKALTKANSAGICHFTDQQIAASAAIFDNFARPLRLAAQSPGTLSSFKELLDKSGLTGTEQAAFADLYFSHQSTGDDFWQEVQAHLSPAKVAGLQLQGKLAYLTLNNAPLAALLQQEIGGDPRQLVSKDLYKPEGWKTLLQLLALKDEQNLQRLIPPTYHSADATTADLLEAYTADLARKVRVSYPTEIVRRMLQNKELQISQDKDNQNVVTFLQKATPLGFELGRTPVNSFIAANQAQLFSGAPPDQVAAAIEGVKTLYRLYQITPTNESLKVLLDQGFTSAQEIVDFSYDDFITIYAHLFPSREEAQLVYRKSQQIAVTTHNLVSAAQTTISGPSLYAIAAFEDLRQQVRKTLIEQFPTLETLFGSLDYCECEHCNSVLSPAAYLVDLLHFLDPQPSAWQARGNYWKSQASWKTFQDTWQKAHPGLPFPDTQQTPYEVLTTRRPDLPYLPLTCENTNTVMPYIDLVNEILEYFIAHGGSLDSDAVHDTGTTTTPELLAEPQNILPAAYDILKNKAVYPLSLPFDLWLETARGFFDYFQLPFWKVLDAFRLSDELFPRPGRPFPNPVGPFPPRPSPRNYYRHAIFAEYLGIAPAEYALYTRADPPAKWFTLYGYQNEADALTALPFAKPLSQKLGISYKDLIALVRTNFINPHLNTLGILSRLGVTPEEVFRYEGQAGYPPYSPVQRRAFERALHRLSAPFASVGFDALAWLHTAWQTGDFKQILVLFDPDAEGNFDQTTLRYADGQAADTLVFLKMNLFVRLWKRLGWSMEETDRALQVFVPQHANPLTGTTLGPAFATALLYIAHLSTLLEQCPSGQPGRLQLLTLWSDLATTGDQPLYARLFLTGSILQNDATNTEKNIFDHPLGLYLSYYNALSKRYLPFHWDASEQEDLKTGNVSLEKHLSTVQGALGLSGDEVGQILVDARKIDDAGQALAAEPLNLATLSLLYRYGLLAKALGLSVHDLIALKALSGLDPFKPLSPDPLTRLADDHPLTQTLRFVEMVASVKASGFTVEDLNYLLRQRFDPVGKYRPDPNGVLALVKTLAAGIRGIQTDNTLPTTSNLTDDFLRQKLALVLPSDVVDTFSAMWNGTIAYSATQQNVAPADKLNPADFAQQPEIQVSYDDGHQEQQLTFNGVLSDAQKTQIEQIHTSPILAALLDQVQQQGQTFFDNYLHWFLTENDFSQLFISPNAGLTDQARRQQFAQAFLPYLQQKLKRQFVVQTLAISLAADPTLTEDLLTNTGLLSDPSNPAIPGQSANPLLGAFVSSADYGVNVAYFASTDGTGPALNAPALVPTVDTTGKPGGANSVHFEGYLEVPADGAYSFFVESGQPQTTAEFCLTNLPDPLKQQATTGFPLPSLPDPLLSVTATSNGTFTKLRAGIPYYFTFDASLPGGGDASLLVQGEDNLPKGSLDRLILYTRDAVERVTRARTLLTKTLQIIEAFGFSESEMRYLLTHADDFANLNLSALPTRAEDDSPAGATALFGQFLRLAAYASLKSVLAEHTDDLTDLFAHARASYPLSVDSAQAQSALLSDLCQRFATLTRRDAVTVQATARALGFTTSATSATDHIEVIAPDFVQEQGLQRLWIALQTLTTTGASMDELSRWLTPDPDFTIANDLRNTVKSHYDLATWQQVAQPIFDKLRQRKRDALVANIMHQQGFDLPGQLFEYFLIDPGMEPVVQTSRLLLAISSVQTFIQRCLLNLESDVPPQAIDSQQWQWMKRYRVWEANRKIFLFPENWLEPEFRDDKTSLFRELESTLLQSDVSNDLAENAFFQYLKSLDVLARLDIVSIYCEQKSDPSPGTLHVIGRTQNLPHQYFSRTFTGDTWTPWQPVTIDIDGDHIIAVVWRQRLHLFWVTFLEKAQQNSTDSDTTYQGISTQPIRPSPKEVDVQLSWSEYFQGAWAPPQSSDFGNLFSDVNGDFNALEDVFIYIGKEYKTDSSASTGDNQSGGMEGALDIHLSLSKRIPGHPFPFGRTFRVPGKNSPPKLVALGQLLPDIPYTFNGYQATKYIENTQAPDGLDTGEFDIRYTDTQKPILQKGREFYSLLFDNTTTGPLPDNIGTVISPQPGQTEGEEPPPWNGAMDNAADSRPLIDALRQCFFYEDDEHTYFVKPTIGEPPIEASHPWAIEYPSPYAHLNLDRWWGDLVLQPAVPIAAQPPLNGTTDPSSLYKLKLTTDWLTGPQALVPYGNMFIGQNRGLMVQKQPVGTDFRKER